MSVKGDLKSDTTIIPEKSSEYNSFSENDNILTKIEEFSSSYSDNGSGEAYAKCLPPKIIADVQVLHDTKSTDKLEDTGDGTQKN